MRLALFLGVVPAPTLAEDPTPATTPALLPQGLRAEEMVDGDNLILWHVTVEFRDATWDSKIDGWINEVFTNQADPLVMQRATQFLSCLATFEPNEQGDTSLVSMHADPKHAKVGHLWWFTTPNPNVNKNQFKSLSPRANLNALFNSKRQRVMVARRLMLMGIDQRVIAKWVENVPHVQ